jgi:hypothetical protein
MTPFLSAVMASGAELGVGTAYSSMYFDSPLDAIAGVVEDRTGQEKCKDNYAGLMKIASFLSRNNESALRAQSPMTKQSLL